MTLEEAIKHAEEVVEERDKLCKRYDDASGYSRSHNETIRTTDAKRCEKCAEEHRQLAEWLKDYKRLLEQASCGDTISRADMLDVVGHGTTYTSEEVQNIVNSLPPVTPKPKTGHWEKTTDKYCYWYTCSCCGTKAPKTEWGNDYFSPYCPECGAKMIPTDSEKE